MERTRKPFYSQAYLDMGEGPTVVLLHGLFGELSLWKETIACLRPHYRIVIPRLPLFSLPMEHINLTYLTEVLYEFLQWHELKNVTLVGHDIGSKIALMHAHKFPEITARAIIAGSAPNILTNSNPSALELDAITPLPPARVLLEEAFHNKDLLPISLGQNVSNTLLATSSREAVYKLSSSDTESELTSVISGIKQPVLIIWGMEDKISTPDIAVNYHNNLPNATLRFIPNCGHLPMIESPDLYIRNMLEFLISTEQ